VIIEPKVRGFLCTTAHPAGCAANVRRQIEYVQGRGAVTGGARHALVIGASTGYGLASRICATFGCGAATVGVFFEKPGSEKRTGSPGWYNAAALQRSALEAGLSVHDFNGDAFSVEMKQRVVAWLQEQGQPLDLVIYSLAAPRRTHPQSGAVHRSVLKPIGREVRERTLDTDRQEVREVCIPAATEEEIADTVAVMGGEDWRLWLEALHEEKLLGQGCKTLAYTYIGERLTKPIYGDATIGAAKKDLDQTVKHLQALLAPYGGEARVAVLKAVVTQASSAIPIMPLYLSLLFRVMKQRGVHEGCIEQIDGLFRALYDNEERRLDREGRLRRDGAELAPEVQAEVEGAWHTVNTDNLLQTTDFTGYREEFMQLFGFCVPGVDYAADLSPVVHIPHLAE